MTDSFKIYKNVNESFSLYISNFVQNVQLSAKSTDAFTMTARPHFQIGYRHASSVDAFSESTYYTVTRAGASVTTYNDTVDNCSILQTLTSSFSSTSTKLGLGSSGSNSFKTWIPFIVAMSPPIISASITFTAAENSASNTAAVKIGCELSGAPIAPAGVSLPDYYNDLNSRIMTTGFTIDASMPAWVIGNTYTYDITAAVSEVLALSTWVSGNTLAVLCQDYGSTLGVNRQAASFQNGTYTAPVLTITTT
jgi:hypothetical protein